MTDSNDFKGNFTDVIDSFDDMGLKEKLLRGIYNYGFENPSPIQQRGIPAIIKNKNVIIQSSSGTGKTATFVTGLLNEMDENLNSCQGLIITNTRELAKQTELIINRLSTFMEKINVGLFIGKERSVREDCLILSKGIHIAIGTPGRIYDLINKNHLNLDNLKMFILDEADIMLSRELKENVHDIFFYINYDVKIVLVSATFCQERLQDIIKLTMVDPEPVLILKETSKLSLEGIKQYYIDVEEDKYKLDTIKDLYDSMPVSQSIMFCNDNKIIEDLTQNLKNYKFSVDFIHGELDQHERNKIIQKFRNSEIRLLISSDLLSRGIDVQQVFLVINYDLPKMIENYIHRIGRSGRYGRKGVTINLITKSDKNFLYKIQNYYKITINELPSDVENIFK